MPVARRPSYIRNDGRESAGPCDVAERCSDSSPICPADQMQPRGTECRASVGACDVAETCDGSTSACPPDGFASAGVQCRAATGACDVAASCSGFSSTCPANGFKPIGTVCRASVDDCDPAESCTGTDAACPTDTPYLDSDGDGVCNGEDDCPDNADEAQADTGNDSIGDACDPCTGGADLTSPGCACCSRRATASRTSSTTSRCALPIGSSGAARPRLSSHEEMLSPRRFAGRNRGRRGAS